MRNRNTVEFLGIWEQLHNPGFNPIEFDGIKKQAGLNSFILTVKQWNQRTGAIGLISKAGRYGGTYAHKDIAFEFASWISVELKLYLIKEFQRLKEDENQRLSLAWNLNRTLSKLNYRIHTDAIKTHLIPPEITPAQAAITYASEADLQSTPNFSALAALIESRRGRAVRLVNRELIALYWELGGHINQRIAVDGWGRGTITLLATYLSTRMPSARGFSAFNLWRMRQFFET